MQNRSFWLYFRNMLIFHNFYFTHYIVWKFSDKNRRLYDRNTSEMIHVYENIKNKLFKLILTSFNSIPYKMLYIEKKSYSYYSYIS